MNSDNMSFLEHTQELRSRLLKSLFVFAAIFCVLMAFFPSFVLILTKPLARMGKALYAFRVEEGILVAMESCFWAAVVFSSPFWTFQLAAFILPAFGKSSKATFIVWFFGCFFLVLAGFAFSYFVMIPLSLTFLMSFSTHLFTTFISAENYIRFFLSLFMLSGIIFQTPLIMLLLGKIGIIDVESIGKNRKFVIVAILIIAAIITPPDVISQIIFFVPMYLLFEFGIILCKISTRATKKEEW